MVKLEKLITCQINKPHNFESRRSITITMIVPSRARVLPPGVTQVDLTPFCETLPNSGAVTSQTAVGEISIS